MKTRQAASLHALELALSQARPYMIVAPPRSASTALARCLLNHSRIGPYIHEPCDLYRHQSAPLESILARLRSGALSGSSLIKEMTFQLGTAEVAWCFLHNAKPPIVFLIRSPLLAIESRVRMVLSDLAKQKTTTSSQKAGIEEAVKSRDYRAWDEVLNSRVFPLSHTGWTALSKQIQYCRQTDIDYVVVSAAAFRSEPRDCLRMLSHAWNLKYESAMVEWTAEKELPLGALADQNAWYSKVTSSKGVLPETAAVRPARLPARFLEHLAEANETYRQILHDSNALIAKREVSK